MKNIEVANIGKRLLAAILDAVIALFTYVVLALYVFTPIANAGLNYEGNVGTLSNYMIYSHLYVMVETDGSGVSNIINVSSLDKVTESYTQSIISVQIIDSYIENVNYSTFEQYLRYYYLNYKTGQNIEYPPESMMHENLAIYASPICDVPIVLSDGQEVLPKDYYNEDWYLTNILRVDSADSPFVLAIDDENLEQPYLSINTSEEEAIIYLKQAIYDANADMYYADYYQEVVQAINYGQMVSFIPPFFFCLFFYYLLIPMLFKNGETLCKKMLNLGLLNIKEYQVTRPQILLRQMVLITELTFFFFIFAIIQLNFSTSFIFTYIATLCLGVLILFIVTLFSKKRRTLHDYVALTFVIDTRKSVWFDNINDEEEHEAQLEENMAKYNRNSDSLNDNVIQIGDKILENKTEEIASLTMGEEGKGEQGTKKSSKRTKKTDE